MRGEVAFCPIGSEAGGAEVLLQAIDQFKQCRRACAAPGPEQLIVRPVAEPVDQELEGRHFNSASNGAERWQGSFGDFAEKGQCQVNGVGSGRSASKTAGHCVRQISQHQSARRVGPESEENPGRGRLVYWLSAIFRRHVPPAQWPAPQWPLHGRGSPGARWFYL